MHPWNVCPRLAAHHQGFCFILLPGGSGKPEAERVSHRSLRLFRCPVCCSGLCKSSLEGIVLNPGPSYSSTDEIQSNVNIQLKKVKYIQEETTTNKFKPRDIRYIAYRI